MTTKTTVSLDTTTIVALMLAAGMIVIGLAVGLMKINETLEQIRDRLPEKVVTDE